ncbi:hypothetical protein BVG19_g4148 [[Candida] boidinii]|nr:hypothetical protein BVG19_g4148 [[Candida] boidinii]OWB51140.1 hypothetical protein B5S27_g2698 [[Candida] boidinii]
MGKSKETLKLRGKESNSNPILNIKFNDPLFTFASSSYKNIIALGSANGYVKLINYNDTFLQDSYNSYIDKTNDSVNNNNNRIKNKKYSPHTAIIGEKSISLKHYDHVSGEITDGNDETEDFVSVSWKTKRHKGSCRSIVFDYDGESIYSMGSDNVIKLANTETGKVINKTDDGFVKELGNTKLTKILSAPNKNFLLTSTENGNLFVFDKRDLRKKIYDLKNLHDDSINDLSHLSPKSDYQFISLGSTNLTHFDLRKGPITKSEDQEDELLCGSFMDPTSGSNFNTYVTGLGEGLVTIWDYSKNRFNDQISRIKINKNQSIDCLVPDFNNLDANNLFIGSSDGLINKLNIKNGNFLESRIHSLSDEVSSLDFDYNYRLISSGMDNLKIWSNDDKDESDDEDDMEESDSDESDFNRNDSDNGDSDSEDGDSDSEDEAEEEWNGFDDNDQEDQEDDQEEEEEQEQEEQEEQEQEEQEEQEEEEQEEQEEEEELNIFNRMKSSIKRRLSGLINNDAPAKAQKTQPVVGTTPTTPTTATEDLKEGDISGEEVSDSDDDNEIENKNITNKENSGNSGKVVELSQIRDKLLKQLEDSDEDGDNGSNVDSNSDNEEISNTRKSKKFTKKEKMKLKKQKKLDKKSQNNSSKQSHEHGIRKFDDL